MRVSTQQIFQSGIKRIQDVNVQLQKTQQQVSSGKRVLNPSDDPVAATRILQLNQDLARTDQFKKNIDLAENRLQQEDSTLGSVNDLLIRVKELTVKAGDGALNAQDRKFLASELRERLDQLAGLGNARNARGEYMFGGFKGAEAPFEQNVSGAWVYTGDEGQRSLEVDDGVQVPINDNGKGIFVDVRANEPSFFTRASDQNKAEPPATISAGLVMDKEAFGELYPEDIRVEFTRNVTSGAVTYSAYERNSGRELVTDEPYVNGEAISVAGAQFTVSGDPADGDTFFVQTAEKQSVFTTVEKLIDGLENYSPNPAYRQAFDNLLENSLANLDEAQNNVLEARTRVGARLNTVETTREFHADSELLNQEVKSDLEDLDYAKAVSRLSQQNFVLQAAQQSFAQVSRLSLFDSL
ncbi:flagellar hook-associated protein FlgL [Marinobacteraceae bacterium S3BR75-40.1]